MSNVMYDSHGVESLGDMHQYGNIDTNKKGKIDKENPANSTDYHFHATIQHLEDGLQEQWKEQNRNMNKNRTNPVSSMTDAKFRKLVTSMMFPIMQNILCAVGLFFITPLFFAFKTDGLISIGIGLVFVLFLISNIFFDAFVIYRARKYVIEKVTNKYYKILRNSWRSYELTAIFLFIIAIVVASFLFTMDELSFSIEKVNTVLSYFDLINYAIFLIAIGILYFITYYMFISKISNDAKNKQIDSIKEARSSSEHNADVAQSILDGTLGDFENE